MTPRHALLISADPACLEAIESPLRQAWAGCEVHRAHPAGSPLTPKLVLGQPGAMAVWDRRARLKTEILKALQVFAAGGGRVVALAPVPRSELDLQVLREPATARDFEQLVHNLRWDSPRLAEAIVAAGREGCETVLGAPDLGTVERLGDAQLKGDFIAALTSRLEAAQVQRTWRSKLGSVVDELLMNALYHAPQGAPSDMRERMASLKWSWDQRAGFRATVWDECGTYRREDAMRKIRDFLNQEMVEITRTSGRGGGVGLFLVLKTADEYTLFIEPGIRTEISVRIAASAGRSPDSSLQGGVEILAYFRR